MLSFGSKHKGVGLGFTDKRLFLAKMGRKSVFYPREAHILIRLDNMVLYTNFLMF
jgi:hypothetical protein